MLRRTYYTGVTNDVDKRFELHIEGLAPNCFTLKRRPVILKYHEHFLVTIVKFQSWQSLRVLKART